MPLPLAQAQQESAAGNFEIFDFLESLHTAVGEAWTPPSDVQTSMPESSIEIDSCDAVLFDLDGPTQLPWSIALTPSFKKSVAGADRKLQGRILSALTELSEAPLQLRGDTVKPLSGALKGLWRYRIGDYRLMYEPHESRHLVVLLAFVARGDVYD